MRKPIPLFTLAVAVCLLAVLSPSRAGAVTPKEQYLEADACYRQLLKTPDKQKYRENWFGCIRKFEAVYRLDPAGAWAAAGLYMSGKLYRELYSHSYREADRKEALDIYTRVVKRYPRSRYRQRATAELESMTGTEAAKSDPVPEKTARVEKKPAADTPGPKGGDDGAAKSAYLSADNCYRSLLKNAKDQQRRDRWLRCIRRFEDAYRKDPSGPWAAASLYMAGELYRELHGKSFRKADVLAANDRYERVLDQFPDSAYAEKAAKTLGRPVPEKKPDLPLPVPEKKHADADDIAAVIGGAATPEAAEAPGRPDGEMATVQGLRYWSNPSYTRVVIDADRDASFTHRLLKKDPSIQKPQRLYVDLNGARLGTGIPKTIPINDNLLIDARAGQYTAQEVRVVVDIKSFDTYKIFSLRNPFRIVIDVWGEREKTPPKSAVAAIPEKGAPLTAGALAKQLALGVSRIVIDPGHGGRDFGAPGYLKGVHEKNIVLELSKRLAAKIKEKIGCEVIMTRRSDRYLTLEERTALANTQNADLFISIHTNSARSRNAYGIETFFLNLATDDDAILVAARENATSRKNISDLQTILSDLMQNAKINESSRLAGYVQNNLFSHMNKRYSRIKDKGVKQAPFYVLLGAQMPAILIETSFISNPRECRRLNDSAYQEHLCEGIVQGIQQYIREINPTARLGAPTVDRPTG